MEGRMQDRGSNLQTLLDLIGFVQTLHQRSSVAEIHGDKVEGVVTECPFSAYPPEICHQYEAFFNGVCEVIDPEYEFAYHRMMTKGDKTCQWTISRKDPDSRERAREEHLPEDPAKMLAVRLAKSEISEEEFDRKMALMRKHSLVK
jgi:hypothetical protein